MIEQNASSESESNLVNVAESLLDFQPKAEDQIGHNTVMNGKGYRVVILSFPQGYLLKEHKTPKTLLIQALDGRFRFSCLNHDHVAEPGKLFQLEPSVPHEVEALEAGHLQLILLD